MALIFEDFQKEEQEPNMTADERLAFIRVKTEWAKKHLRDLEIARDRFIETKPYAVHCETDSNTGYLVYKITRIDPPPPVIALLTGDTIHNLRSALDHLVYQLVLVNGAVPTKQTAFPVFDDAVSYKTGSIGKIKGMAQAAIDRINASQPYKGGSGEMLWCLHYLDIADKHHALLVTLVAVTEIEIGLRFPKVLPPGYRPPIFDVPGVRTALEVGDEFFRCEPGVEQNAEAVFDVALREPEILEGKPVLEFLHEMTNLIDRLTHEFSPFLG